MTSHLRFPRAFRIRSNARFSRIFREGRRARGEVLVVVGAENGLGHPRLGLSVGKRIWKSAVKRNRIRRVFRESFRLVARDLPPLDLILIPAQPKSKPNTRDTQRELVKLAAKVARRLEEAKLTGAPRPGVGAAPPGARPDATDTTGAETGPVEA